MKYKVLREKADANWYPVFPWDWFYGNGYGWFSYDTPWLPGFFRWGCCRPASPWNPHYPGPPEVVAEAETKIKPDGTIDIPVDTSLAKALFPDDSQRYTITAEVIDNSRRTITGTGTVLVAKEPFKIYAWTDKGHYVENQKIAVNFQARRLDGKAVSGEGEVKLYRLSYDTSLIANETSVYAGKIKFSDDGQAAVSLNAATAGQYRVSCVLNGQEGGYVFNVYEKTGGKVAESSEGFRYNALELIPDKTEYKTGEQVQLRINTNRENAAVLLFLKPANGVASMDGNYKPQLIQMKGKSQIVSVPVELRDMPNFFVEALSVSDGTIADEVKEIAVPPLQKILNVNIKSSSENYKPGEKAKAEIAVTDLDGKPVVGQTVVSIYDKSVEYISGGTNVGDIKEFFWEWRRHHYPQNDSNLDKYTQIFGEPNKPDMQNLGIFGYMVRGRGTEHFLPRENVTVMGGMGGGMMLDSTQKSDADAVPMVAAAPMSGLELQENAFVRGRISGTGVMNKSGIGMDKTGGAELVQPAIRKNFADTAFWVGALETDKNGKANIELTMPESLTTWKINVWDMSSGTRVGYGSTEVITRKNLIIRMQTPRFLVEKDKCVFTANAVCTNQGFKSITPYILKINEYLYYYLTTRVEDIRSRASGTTFKEISGTEFGNTIVGIPPLAEQRRIVTAIESAFAVIDEIERNKSDLQSAVAAAKSKILSLAIRGKLVPQDLDDDPASVLLERIRTEKESLIKTGKIKGDKNNSAIVRGDDNSYYQELPESWEQVFIGETHSIIRGITFPATAKQKSCADGVVSCVTTGSVQSKYNSLADVFIPECYVRNSAQWLKYNDIIMSSANSRELVGKTCLWKEHTRKTFGGFLTVVRASKHIFPTYSFFVLQYLWKSGAFIDSSTQTTNIANINNSILASTSFPLPSLAEQRRIVAAIETAFEQLDNIAAMLE